MSGQRATWIVVLVAVCGPALIKVSGQTFPDTSNQSNAPQRPPGVIPLGDQPGHWVPFSANLTRVFNPGNVAVGRFYRASNGSTRSETGPSMREVTAMLIKNEPERMYYTWTATAGWNSFPVDAPAPGKYLQPRKPDIPPGTILAEETDGFELVKSPIESEGVTSYEAPRLNYFKVKIIMPCNDRQSKGCGQWLSDIKISEQPPELFAPPDGRVP